MPRLGDQRSKGEALWRFSLALYARPGIAEALLRLHDRAGHDINLMLFCLWLGAVEGRRLDPPGLAAAEAVIRPFAAPISTLRALRRDLKRDGDGAIQAVRRRVAALEIATEREAQMALAALPTSASRAAGDSLAAAAANLALCLGGDTGSDEAAVLRRELALLTRRAVTPVGRP